jgi:hypothetical protein
MKKKYWEIQFSRSKKMEGEDQIELKRRKIGGV